MIVKTKLRKGLSPALLATQRKQPIKEVKGKGEDIWNYDDKSANCPGIACLNAVNLNF